MLESTRIIARLILNRPFFDMESVASFHTFFANASIKHLEINEFYLSIKAPTVLEYCLDYEDLFAEKKKVEYDIKYCLFQNLYLNCKLETLRISAGYKLSSIENYSFLNDIKFVLEIPSLKSFSLDRFDLSCSRSDCLGPFKSSDNPSSNLSQKIFELAAKSCKLKTLSLTNCKLYCIYSLNPALSLLDVSSNYIADEAVENFLLNVSKHKSKLDLNLSNNPITNPSYKLIKDAINTTCKFIESLSLSKLLVTDKQLIDFCSGILFNKTLISLDVSYIPISDPKLIVESFMNHGSLRSVDFSNCGLVDSTIKELSYLFSLTSKNRIEKINLSYNYFTTINLFNSFVLMLKSKGCVTDLNLSHCLDYVDSNIISLDKLFSCKSLRCLIFIQSCSLTITSEITVWSPALNYLSVTGNFSFTCKSKDTLIKRELEFLQIENASLAQFIYFTSPKVLKFFNQSVMDTEIILRMIDETPRGAPSIQNLNLGENHSLISNTTLIKSMKTEKEKKQLSIQSIVECSEKLNCERIIMNGLISKQNSKKSSIIKDLLLSINQNKNISAIVCEG